ncbi:MAG: Tim44-like domain-containing protein [Pseudomonadota bacterium]
MKLWTIVLAGVLAMGALDAEAARRLGGGGSFGKQSGNVTQRQATPPAQQPAQAAPAQQQSATAAKPATPAAAAAPRRPWGAMLGGLAAGLGLAWLANSLGLGAEFAQFMMFALLALVIMVVVGAVMRARRNAAGAAAQMGRPLAFEGAGASVPEQATAPRQYSPDKVGNDASARPWEHSGGSGLQIGSAVGGSALGGSPGWGIPAGFDVAGFVGAAKRNFVTLQDAWDRADIDMLRSMMTDEMVSEIRTQLAEREKQRGGTQPNKTDVVMLEAQLLGVEELPDGYLASVEFSGMIREEPSAGPSPFREVWNMSKPKAGTSGWLVAGVQALQ